MSALVTEALAAKGHILAAPVSASFRTSEQGSCGVELTVKLDDPRAAKAVRAALVERFGGEAAVDVVRVS